MIQTIVGFFDAPQVLDCSVTPIPGSGNLPLQVVASLKGRVTKIQVVDGIASYVGLYVGDVGNEELHAVIAGGTVYELLCPIAKGSRVSLRSLSASAINAGSLCVTFFG